MVDIQTQPEKVTDEQLINLIEAGVQNSVGDWLNSSDLTRERIRATYEFAGVPQDHLAPNGVSTIVDTSTTEVIEAYTAVLSDLFLSNKKLARFTSYEDDPMSQSKAFKASQVVNYCLFHSNMDGWNVMSDWMKAALLWKNGVVRWDYIEDFEYKIEEYERIDQSKLDELLSDDAVEIVGELEYESETEIDDEVLTTNIELVYVNVRIKRKINRSRVRVEGVPQENFRISRDANGIDDAAFVGIQTDMTRTDIRKYWPQVASNIEEEGIWDELGNSENWLGNARYSEDIAARKEVTGQEYWQGSVSQDLFPLEANREITVSEAWLRVDRDGDGIAELKHFIIAGDHILFEEDVDMIPLATLVPISIPYEFYGLSMADFTRSSTLASTAILRGFVENTYLTNYAPKLADPNVVDFSALQNMKPKQIIPTNGNPTAAVQPLDATPISSGTVPLLEHLQLIKEQATGMSKAAQGLNDTLYVSGNSEEKLQAVQSASQKRIQHIARMFAETGFKRLIIGVYETMRSEMKEMRYLDTKGVYSMVKAEDLPSNYDVEIMIDVGENSNSNKIMKLTRVLTEMIPQLKGTEAGVIVKDTAIPKLTTDLLVAMDMDPGDVLEDVTSEEFAQKLQQHQEQQAAQAEEQRAADIRATNADASLKESNAHFASIQADNAIQDNTRQMAVAIDKSFQAWADLSIKAQKEGVELPNRPSMQEIMQVAAAVVNSMTSQPQPQAAPQQVGINPDEQGGIV